jgi:hypothetical protein
MLRAPGLRGLLGRLSATGAAAQASVPGAYAWAVTVAPAAWSKGATGLAKAAAVVALLALFGGIAGERAWGARARFVSLWAFVLASALAWSSAPTALGPLRVEPVRGLSGMLGWALFAFASAAPALPAVDPRPDLSGGLEGEPPVAARGRLGGWDGACVTVGILLAAVMQGVGWRVANVERALLVRFMALAAGLAVIGAATDVVLERRRPRAVLSPARRARRAMPALVLLTLLAIAGLMFALRG